MSKTRIVAWLKPTCGWSQGVRAVLRKYDLTFEDRDIINNPDFRREMVERSGQPLSPCVEVDGHLLADVSGSELEAYLLANHLVAATHGAAEAPTDQPCAGEPQTAPVACVC